MKTLPSRSASVLPYPLPSCASARGRWHPAWAETSRFVRDTYGKIGEFVEADAGAPRLGRRMFSAKASLARISEPHGFAYLVLKARPIPQGHLSSHPQRQAGRSCFPAERSSEGREREAAEALTGMTAGPRRLAGQHLAEHDP